MSRPIVYVVLATISEGLWAVFHKLAAPHITQVFGAIVISLTAVVFGGFFFLVNYKNIQLFTDVKGIVFVVLAGIAAFGIDFFILQAFSRGMALTVGGPIIIVGSTFMIVVIGFMLGESISFLKIFCISLMLIGAAILSVVE